MERKKMLTKLEMEAIWNSREIGAVKRLSKTRKNQSLYKVTVRFWEKHYIDQHEIVKTVWATTATSAHTAANISCEVVAAFPNGATRPQYETKVEKING